MARKDSPSSAPVVQPGGNHQTDDLDARIARIHQEAQQKGICFGDLLRLTLKDKQGGNVFVEVSQNLAHACEFLRKQVDMGRVCIP